MTDRIRVMTYNVRYDTPKDGDQAWHFRRDAVAHLIERYEPDLLGLQEPLRHQIDDLIGRFDRLRTNRNRPYNWIGVGREDGRDLDEFSPIFYRRDRFVSLQSGTFWLSATPQVVGSQGWDGWFPRIVTYACFRDKVTRQILWHFNTHFDHIGTKARTEAAKLLVGQIAERVGDNAVVVTGDFNCTRHATAYQILMAGGLRDAQFECEHEGPLWTVVGATVTRPKIDYIFVGSGITVFSHRTIADKIDGEYPSDHLAVSAEIALIH